MADRTAARIFGMIFSYLAEGDPSEEAKQFAWDMWNEAGGFDFDPYQMYVDGSLAKLGLLRVLETQGEDGPYLECVYPGDPDFDTAREPQESDEITDD